jgi:AraC-like DNA-binding protein
MVSRRPGLPGEVLSSSCDVFERAARHEQSMGTASRARPRNHEAFAREVAAEVRGFTGQLGAAGWRFIDIATALGCSETQLRAWRDGEVEPRASVLKALHALAARELRRSA